MKRTTAVFALTALSGIAAAQRDALEVRVRRTGQAQWVQNLNYIDDGAASLQVEVGVFYEHATGYGFSAALHHMAVNNWRPDLGDTFTLLDRPDSPLHPDGRQGRFNFSPQAQAGYFHLDLLRVADASNSQDSAAAGISVWQDNPVASGSLFDTGNVVLGFRFDLSIARRFLPGPQTYELFPRNFALFSVYDSSDSTTEHFLNVNNIIVEQATITANWLPAPSGIAPVLLWCAARRRR